VLAAEVELGRRRARLRRAVVAFGLARRFDGRRLLRCIVTEAAVGRRRGRLFERRLSVALRLRRLAAVRLSVPLRVVWPRTAPIA